MPDDPPIPRAGTCPFLAGPRSPAPPLSILPRPGRMSFFTWYRLMRDDSMAVIPQAAFEEEVLETKFLWARGFLLNHPDGLRHVLRDNAANYPKTGELARMVEPVLGRGLLTTEGEVWRRHRRLMAPFFDQRSIGSYAPSMTAATAAVMEEWAPLPSGTVVDVQQAMKTAAARTVLHALFSSNAGALGTYTEEGMEEYQAQAMPNLLDLLQFPERVAGARRRRTARRTFGPIHRILEGIIAERRASADGGPDDLLGRLIRVRDGETGAGLSAEEIRGEVIGIYFAGHETTSLALSWTWYLLALHPEVRARLDQEIQTVLQGRPPVSDDVPKLTYAAMVVQESLRLYPPVFAISHRVALADDVLCGRRVPAGAYISIIPWVLHRHRRLWDEPERFDPERFSPARSAGRHRYAYLPFSAGPRGCLGASFAQTEAVLNLATIGQRYRLRLVPEHPVQTRGLITLRPRQGLRMALDRIA